MSTIKSSSIADSCAPVANPSHYQQTDHSRVWTLTQANSFTLGEETLTIACIPDRQCDESGNFLRQVVHPVAGAIQAHPQVAKKLRHYEYLSGIRTDRTSGLVYHMLPIPGQPPNSWLKSGSDAVRSLTQSWGYVESDRDLGVYRFHRLDISQQRPVSFPAVADLVEELLEDVVIKSLDHPVIQRILGHESSSRLGATGDGNSLATDQEEEYGLYD